MSLLCRCRKGDSETFMGQDQELVNGRARVPIPVCCTECVFLHCWNPRQGLMSIFSPGCLAFTTMVMRGFPCRRKTVGGLEKCSNLYLPPGPMMPCSQGAWTPCALLTTLRNPCWGKEMEAQLEPPTGGRQGVQTMLRLPEQAQAHFLLKVHGAPARIMMLNKLLDPLGCPFSLVAGERDLTFLPGGLSKGLGRKGGPLSPWRASERRGEIAGQPLSRQRAGLECATG